MLALDCRRDQPNEPGKGYRRVEHEHVFTIPKWATPHETFHETPHETFHETPRETLHETTRETFHETLHETIETFAALNQLQIKIRITPDAALRINPPAASNSCPN